MSAAAAIPVKRANRETRCSHFDRLDTNASETKKRKDVLELISRSSTGFARYRCCGLPHCDRRRDGIFSLIKRVCEILGLIFLGENRDDG